ncbi:carbohydrate-binding protein AQN-1-like isoform X2 [Bos javanicus]|uniref:carbohydrate-binding protein AQN-1-like isoform X2 n=1 Tax=Bos javanicus TaxID=9906 RepID=UPI002AA69086|nr:carbohydrate-binding protein AQN-1-like isoform X2 [Bos javanicus]
MHLTQVPDTVKLLQTTTVSTESDEDARKCGGVRRNFSGRISSYSSWEPKCTWTILLERGYRIVLTIPFLSLNCNEEYVEITDGLPDSTTFGKFCSGGHLVFRSSSNVITVKYYRSSNQPVSSFDIFYYGRPSVLHPQLSDRAHT